MEQNSTACATVFMISADCGYPLRLLPAVNEKKKRQRENPGRSESTEFGRCGARIPRKRRHLIGEAYMEAFIRPKRECINSWANLFRNNRAKFRRERGKFLPRVRRGRRGRAWPQEMCGVNVYALKEARPCLAGGLLIEPRAPELLDNIKYAKIYSAVGENSAISRD